MVNIDATTPQLKVVKTWLEAYNTLNVDHVEPFISKNFVCKTFPKSSLTPDEGKARHLEKFAGIAAICAKTEVCIHCWYRLDSQSHAPLCIDHYRRFD